MNSTEKHNYLLFFKTEALGGTHKQETSFKARGNSSNNNLRHSHLFQRSAVWKTCLCLTCTLGKSSGSMMRIRNMENGY